MPFAIEAAAQCRHCEECNDEAIQEKISGFRSQAAE